jgi:hypothetical protein
MTYWSLRTEELQDPATRQAVLRALVFALERSQPDLLVLIRKMIDMIDEAEGDMERLKDEMQSVIDDLEKELFEAKKE